MNRQSSSAYDRPFPSVPASQRYLEIGPLEEARQRVGRMLQRGEGLAVVIGPPGTGKTLLMLKLGEMFSSTHRVIALGQFRLTSRLGLVQQVLFHLQRPYQGMDEDALHLELAETLTSEGEDARPLLLLIDEAQSLTADLLDEVRTMTNLIRGQQSLVSAVMFGGPRLEERLADPQQESLAQRIAVRCYLHPLRLDETEFYIEGGLTNAAVQMDPAAIPSVHHASGGIPRLISQLMTQAIDIAAARGQRRLDETVVQMAWAELQQLPSPVLEAELRPVAAIEFGELDAAKLDEQEPPSTAAPRLTAVENQPVAVDQPSERERSEAVQDVDLWLQPGPIDCLSEYATDTTAWAETTSEMAADATLPTEAPAGRVPTDEAEVMSGPAVTGKVAQPDETTPPSELLFGDGFEQETDLPLGSILPLDPLGGERSLHEEVRCLADWAEAVVSTTDPASETDVIAGPALAPTASDAAPQSLATQLGCSGQPACGQACGERRCGSCGESSEPAQPAACWGELPMDDSDMLVVEEDVALTVEPPSSGLVASGGLRQPSHQIEQNYQDLFSRLRGQR